MIPTLLGIMVINFFVIQAAPGGPVEQAISQIQGTRRRHQLGSPAAARRQRPPRKRRRAASNPTTCRAAARGLPPELIERIRKQYGFDKPIGERFFQMMRDYLVVRPRRELLPQPARGRPGDLQDAGVDLARPVDHAAGLLDLDPARHRQGGARRLALRRRLVLGRHHRQRHPGLPVRAAAGRAVRRRQLLEDLSPARHRLRRLAQPVVGRPGRRLCLAHGPADHGHGDRRFRHAHHADQELLPRGDRQAVRADRPGQGPDGVARALRPCLPQRHADRHRRLPRRLHRRAVQRLASDRGHLLARRHGTAGLRGGARTATTR